MQIVTDDKCQDCKKDWTKCAKCPVMMKWVKEHKASPTGAEGSEERLRALPPVNPAQKWIPCSERLPDNAVLCCGENGEMIIGYPYEDDDYYTGYCAENDGTILVDCVAWMPLPEPYKASPTGAEGSEKE